MTEALFDWFDAGVETVPSNEAILQGLIVFWYCGSTGVGMESRL